MVGDRDRLFRAPLVTPAECGVSSTEAESFVGMVSMELAAALEDPEYPAEGQTACPWCGQVWRPWDAAAWSSGRFTPGFCSSTCVEVVRRFRGARFVREVARLFEFRAGG